MPSIFAHFTFWAVAGPAIADMSRAAAAMVPNSLSANRYMILPPSLPNGGMRSSKNHGADLIPQKADTTAQIEVILWG
jgi:hypothetical protein